MQVPSTMTLHPNLQLQYLAAPSWGMVSARLGSAGSLKHSSRTKLHIFIKPTLIPLNGHTRWADLSTGLGARNASILAFVVLPQAQ